jgi:hypothetical protein
MSSAKGLRQVESFDCPSGGQIVVGGTIAFIGHMHAPAGTSIAGGVAVWPLAAHAQQRGRQPRITVVRNVPTFL